jgi:SAM-dependent methyltransferase
MHEAAEPDPASRFSERVQHYIVSRPSYPEVSIDAIELYAGLSEGATVADIGSGTGIFSKLLLDRGYHVFGVEPNAAMRCAAEQLLCEELAFESVPGRAEQTGLPDASCDAVTAAQAFHWFDSARARAEMYRILKPGGSIVLIWNQRHLDTTQFLRAYEEFLHEWGTDYDKVSESYEDPESIAALYRGAEWRVDTFPNVQHFDYHGLCSRVLSCSYVPGSNDPRRAPMLSALRVLFNEFAEDGHVTFEYDTNVYIGRA